jgi:hypothetical protein
MVQGSRLAHIPSHPLSKISKISKVPQIRPARSVALAVSFLIAFVCSPSAPLGPEAAAADPMTDSFATGAKKPARPAAPPASKGSGGGSRSGSRKPAAPAAKRRPGVKTKAKTKTWNEDVAPAAADTRSAPEEEAPPAPRREPPEDSPRARRATESDGRRSFSDDGDRRSSDSAESSDERDENDEDERPRAARTRMKARPAPARRPVATKARKRPSDDEESEGGDNDEEDENEDNGPSAETLPSIAPRAFALGLGLGLMGRTFEFAAPAQLQKEKSFGRFGYAIDVESFPLMLLSQASKDWWQRIGLGFSYAAEPIGQASVKNPSNGTSVQTPVDQSRWSIDLRAALPLGGRVVVTPRLGLESSSFTLDTKTPIMASACSSTSTVACLPDTSTKMLVAGAILRVAASPDLGLWLGAAYLVSLHVENKPANQIGYEMGTSATGLGLDAGASLRFADWLAVRAYVPITRIAYAFHPIPSTPASVTYRNATELVWGFGAALAVFTN